MNFKSLFVSCFTIGGLSAVCSCNSEPSFGEHLSTVSWLPATASDISFSRERGWFAYEFTITEPEFKKWASTDFTIVPIVEPLLITRYTASRDGLNAPGTSVTLRAGLQDETISSSGSGHTLGYDTTHQKAYYHWQAH